MRKFDNNDRRVKKEIIERAMVAAVMDSRVFFDDAVQAYVRKESEAMNEKVNKLLALDLEDEDRAEVLVVMAEHSSKIADIREKEDAQIELFWRTVMDESACSLNYRHSSDHNQVVVQFSRCPMFAEITRALGLGEEATRVLSDGLFEKAMDARARGLVDVKREKRRVMHNYTTANQDQFVMFA